jgi:hypothetical protein
VARLVVPGVTNAFSKEKNNLMANNMWFCAGVRLVALESQSVDLDLRPYCQCAWSGYICEMCCRSGADEAMQCSILHSFVRFRMI